MNWKGAVTPQRAAYVAANMRQRDRLEVFHWSGDTPEEAVAQALGASVVSICILGREAQPLGLCGVTAPSSEDGCRLIWMLGTDELTSTREYRRMLVLEGRRWVEAVAAAGLLPLANACAWNNTRSRRWLRALGFQFGTPFPAGTSGRLFVNFWRNE